MKETFTPWNPNTETQRLLGEITEILLEYFEMGYRLTLRQLYYQLVAADLIPNSVKSYNRIGNIVSRGRLAGIIDWDSIEDRVRIPQRPPNWESGADILSTASRQFRTDRWEGQDRRVEVWCEKDAVSNIIQCKNTQKLAR